MTLEIPTHHIRQKLCDTRLPYREGRNAKAVKVYTVNNESYYLLIQGVPSVGANQELLKLCQSFGQIDQFNALDEYPCSDEYTEVYLVKFKKLVSARFAKRKLDDYSFFGGVLHVCYVPEYETVNETREKLHDRRRVIAAKLKENEGKQLPRSSNSFSKNKTLTEHSTVLDIYNTTINNALLSQSSHLASQVNNNSISICPKLNISHSEQTNHLEMSKSCEILTLPSAESFELPLPPKEVIKKIPKPVSKNSHNGHLLSHKNVIFQAIGKNMENSNTFSKLVSHQHSTKACEDKSEIKKLFHNSTVIVRKIQNSKPAPRFIPRQTIKTFTQKNENASQSSDSLDQEIRKNAFKLGETQGPSNLPNRKRELSPNQKSVTETILAIRTKISKVIAQEVKNHS